MFHLLQFEENDRNPRLHFPGHPEKHEGGMMGGGGVRVGDAKWGLLKSQLKVKEVKVVVIPQLFFTFQPIFQLSVKLVDPRSQL